MKKLSYVIFAAAGFMLFACGETRTDNDRIESGREVSDAKDINDERLDSTLADNNGLFGKSDADFVVEAAANGMAELEAARLAADKATNTQVKEFAAMLVKDHEGVNASLKTLASGKGITLPTTVKDSEQRDLSDLREKSGADFDKEFMDMMVDLHQEDVNRLEKMADNAEDAQIRNFAASNLPKMKQHLEKAKSIKDNLK